MFHHVLLATDFSPPAMIAATSAAQLAAAFGARVTLMSVYDPDRAELRARTLESLQVLREERFGRVPHVELVAVGHRRPDVAVTGHAVASKPDIIFAGRHGHHELGERLIGSTTERIVRHAPCSVWVAAPSRRDSIALAKHILACTDFSQSAEQAVSAAGGIARRFDAWVTLMHVWDLVPNLDVLREPRDEHPDPSFAAVIADKLEKLRTTRLDGVPASTLALRDKSVVTAVLDFAGDKEVDLIVLSTHGRTGVRRLLLGSVAERVVRHASAPVLVVR